MATPTTVIEELKADARRKAAFKMYYAAADVFRDYKGLYAQETAIEREQFAMKYHEIARAAEEARWGGGAPPEIPEDLVDAKAAPARPAAPTRPATPAVKKPATPPKPKPAGERPKTKPASPRKPAPGEEYQIEGDTVKFTCRWCKEVVNVEVAKTGKLAPCPKCDMLVRVPGGKGL